MALFPSSTPDGAAHIARHTARLRAEAQLAAARTPAPRRLGVVGAGTMGRTIALAGLEAGLGVVLVDSNAQQLLSAGADVARWAARGGIAGAVECSGDLAALAGVDVVVESVFEDLAVKSAVLRAIEAVVGGDALIATNSSTLDIDALAGSLARPERFLGTHFFLPAHRTPVLEIVAGKASSPVTQDRALALAQLLGKLPIRAGNGDGYVGNRLFDRLWQEAVYLVEEGAEPQAVDGALTRWGMALGPLATLDRIGNDLLAGVLARRAAARPGLRQPHLLAALVAAGRRGVSAGAGWYDYAPGSRQGTSSPAVAALSGAAARSFAPQDIVARCLAAVIAEGDLLLAEGMAREAGDIDAMFVAAYGFPAATGGPMYLAAAMTQGACA